MIFENLSDLIGFNIVSEIVYNIIILISRNVSHLQYNIILHIEYCTWIVCLIGTITTITLLFCGNYNYTLIEKQQCI
jgi:hypothetical protein